MTVWIHRCCVATLVATCLLAAVGDAWADRVAVGTRAGGVNTFSGDPSSLTAGPGDCCFIGDGQIVVEWLDYDHLAVGSHSAASPTTSDVSVRLPFSGFAVTNGIGGIGAPLNSLARSIDGSLFFIGASTRQNMQVRPKLGADPGTNCCSGPGGSVADAVGGLAGGPDGSYLVLLDESDPATGPTSLRKIAFNQLEQQNSPIADVVASLSGIEVGTSAALLSDGNVIVGKTDVDLSAGGGGVTRYNGDTLADMGSNCCHPDPVIDVDGDSQGRGVYITSGSVANGELARTDFAGGNAILAGGGLNNTASGAMTTLALLSNDEILIGFENGDLKQFSASGSLLGTIGNVGAAVNSISVVVPEPSAGWMLLVGTAVAARRRMRRRQF